MFLSAISGILAALCLIPSLYHGTVQDLKEFKFSKTHFDSLWVNAAFILTVVMYLALLLEGSWFYAVELLVLSVIATLIFSFIGFRYSSGGDWRALIYVAWIAPFMLVYVLLASGVFGIFQAVYSITGTDDKTPAMFRKVPFALSILLGYLVALGYFAVTSFLG